MKNKRIQSHTKLLIIFIGFLVILGIISGLIVANQYSGFGKDYNFSRQRAYFDIDVNYYDKEGIPRNDPGIPIKDNKTFSIFWYKNVIADACMVFDTKTKRIYAEKTDNLKIRSGIDPKDFRKKYYKNNIITAENAFKILDTNCYY